MIKPSFCLFCFIVLFYCLAIVISMVNSNRHISPQCRFSYPTLFILQPKCLFYHDIFLHFSRQRDRCSPLHASYTFIIFIPSYPLLCSPNCLFSFLYNTCIYKCINTNTTICKRTYLKAHLNN